MFGNLLLLNINDVMLFVQFSYVCSLFKLHININTFPILIYFAERERDCTGNISLTKSKYGYEIAARAVFSV